MKYLSIAHLVKEKSSTNPDFEVLTFEHNGEQETRSYVHLWAHSQRLAGGLKRQGFVSDDYVGLLLQNHLAVISGDQPMQIKRLF